MNNAELICTREALHLTVRQLAELVWVHEHTVRDWESGNNERIPDDVADMLKKIEDVIEVTVEQIKTTFFESKEDENTLAVYVSDEDYKTSIHYISELPLASLHRCLQYRAKVALERKGINVELVSSWN